MLCAGTASRRSAREDDILRADDGRPRGPAIPLRAPGGSAVEVHSAGRRVAGVRLSVSRHIAVHLHRAHGGGLLAGLRLSGARHPAIPSGVLRDSHSLLLVARLQGLLVLADSSILVQQWTTFWWRLGFKVFLFFPLLRIC